MRFCERSNFQQHPGLSGASLYRPFASSRSCSASLEFVVRLWTVFPNGLCHLLRFEVPIEFMAVGRERQKGNYEVALSGHLVTGFASWKHEIVGPVFVGE